MFTVPLDGRDVKARFVKGLDQPLNLLGLIFTFFIAESNFNGLNVFVVENLVF